ncbi:conjugal transfer protein TrbL family protein [Virgibacillus salexigens]|uniref:Conjugal transfer protein TraL n=1 Tax=Virgibacillus kapii TaxID=1638645 RepID=A0ABQ2DZF5_9BACI|nr:conjugal transfer protein TrbL family protein [Virgibacillus kapii]GGJ77394.1 hypothetical protein GCM10007111_43740 [Virgibacillus kapii]
MIKITMLLLLPFLFVFPFATEVFAEEQFYNDVITKYEQEGNGDVEALEETLKSQGLDKYNYESNSIDCSWYDVSCHVNGSFIFTNMVGMMKLGIDQIQRIMDSGFNITGSDATDFKDAFKSLSWIMAAIFLMYQAMKITILYIGDSDDGMNVLQEKLWTVLASGILLGVYPQFYDWIVKLIETVNQAILTEQIKEKEIAISLAVNGHFYGIIIALFLAVILVVFAISFFYRFALFTLLYVTGVIAIPTMLNDTFNLFQVWLKTLVNNFITLTLQIVCFTLGFNQLASLQKGTVIYSIAFFILALSVPAILGQFGASTGSSRAMSSGAKSVIRHVARR